MQSAVKEKDRGGAKESRDRAAVLSRVVRKGGREREEQGRLGRHRPLCALSHLNAATAAPSCRPGWGDTFVPGRLASTWKLPLSEVARGPKQLMASSHVAHTRGL